RRVQAIRSQTARATESIDRLLTYSRHSGGLAQTIDLAPIVDAAIAMRAYTLQRASVSIACERSDADPFRATVEARPILQLVLTLLLFFERRLVPSSPSRIVVRLDRGSADVTVSVTGTSERPGGEGTRAGGGGAGDPLAAGQLLAVKRIAERQHGTLTLE